jgi:hypothetical protein
MNFTGHSAIAHLTMDEGSGFEPLRAHQWFQPKVTDALIPSNPVFQKLMQSYVW